MTATMTGQFLLVILKETTQGGCSIFCRIPELEITDELVDGTPYAYRFRLGSPGCLVFYPDIILADIGDIEAAVVSETYQKVVVFLAILLRSCAFFLVLQVSLFVLQHQSAVEV